MKCLIIAAGKGSRLKHKCLSKPLTNVLGVPLIERVIRTVVKAGIEDFYVVTGYNGENVRRFLDDLACRCRIKMNHIINDEWEKGNGLSVLKAKDAFDDNFILMMCDHLSEESSIRSLKNQPIADGEIILAVDRKTDNPLVDMEDVTKVEIVDERVTNIGKSLKSFNGFDTGIFLCSPVIFKGLEKSISEGKGDSLSDGIKYLAKKGKVKVFDVKNRLWIDVDDRNALKKAENMLLGSLKGKQNDGPVSKYLNRPVSITISRYLAKTPITPNQISLVSFLLSLVAASLFFFNHYLALVTGGILAQVTSIIDGCDGEIARLKFQESDFGGWFDAVLDRYADAFIIFGLTWHAYFCQTRPIILFVGFMAIIGSFMVSYTADKYDSFMRRRVTSKIRIGRDIRVLLIFLGALFNHPYPILFIIAVLMNLETVRRIYICKSSE